LQLSVLDLRDNLHDNLGLIRNLLEAHTVGHLELDCLIHRFLHVLVVAESLPLRIDGVHGPPRKDPSLNELVPVDWILGALLRVLSDNIINLDNFPNGELSPTE
jgi:hypothetical protein